MVKNTDNRKTVAMLLSAGEGRRMQPLTRTIPKPLLPVVGKPLLGVIVKKLMRSGASIIHVNLFHLGDEIEKFAQDKDWPLQFTREERLMGTGGGIGNMATRVNSFDTILIHNGDVISNIDYSGAIKLHQEKRAMVTMILHHSPPPSVTINSEGEVTSIGPAGKRKKVGKNTLGYTGMAVISRKALDFFPAGSSYTMVDSLRNMIEKMPGSVIGYRPEIQTPGAIWAEIGSLSGYLDIHHRIMVDKKIFDPELTPPPLPFNISENSSVHPGTGWSGFLQVGEGSVIQEGCNLSNCVVLKNSTVTKGSSINNAVIYQDGTLREKK
jgi:mannose-1-phosphate guanylyltransferase